MRKKAMLVLVGLALTVGGLVFAGQARGLVGAAPSQETSGYECPVTGETLPCPSCCPLAR